MFDCTSHCENIQGTLVQRSSQPWSWAQCKHGPSHLLHHAQISSLASVCSSEIYTIQGNSLGRPCYLPFLYDGQWFHNCTNIGREDGHLWCATTYDYGKDERWGFCPVKSESSLYLSEAPKHTSFTTMFFLHLFSLSGNGCETFWDTDPLTDSCYQFNFQATLSWSEARISCQQQGADLLSITKLHEQTYINGKDTSEDICMYIQS